AALGAARVLRALRGAGQRVRLGDAREGDAQRLDGEERRPVAVVGGPGVVGRLPRLDEARPRLLLDGVLVGGRGVPPRLVVPRPEGVAGDGPEEHPGDDEAHEDDRRGPREEALATPEPRWQRLAAGTRARTDADHEVTLPSGDGAAAA